jgi:hypothetical protein
MVMRFEGDGRPERPQALAGRIAAADATLRKSRRVTLERGFWADMGFFMVVSKVPSAALPEAAYAPRFSD